MTPPLDHKQGGTEHTRGLARTITVVVAAVSLGCVGRAAEAKEKPVVTLELAYVSLAHTNSIQVFASGLVVCAGFDRVATNQVASQVVTNMLNALESHNINGITSKGLEESIKAEPEGFGVYDSVTTTLTIDLPKGRHRVSCYALDYFAVKYPKISALRRMSAVVDLITSHFSGGDASFDRPRDAVSGE